MWLALVVTLVVGAIFSLEFIVKLYDKKSPNIKSAKKTKSETSPTEKLWIKIVTIIVDIVAVPFAGYKIIESILLISEYSATLNNLGTLTLGSKEYFVWLYLSTIFFSTGLWTLDLEKIKSAGKPVISIFLNDPYSKILPLSLSLLLSITFFGKVIYSRISPSMGGGNVKKVGIISSKYPEFRTSRYKQFYLLTSTNDTFLLIGEDINGSKSSFEIRKDLIDILWSGDPKIFF